MLVEHPFGREVLGDAPVDRACGTADDQVGDAFGLVEIARSPVASKAAIRASVRCMLEFWPR
jgi:hypothetical protein